MPKDIGGQKMPERQRRAENDRKPVPTSVPEDLLDELEMVLVPGIVGVAVVAELVLDLGHDDRTTWT